MIDSLLPESAEELAARSALAEATGVRDEGLLARLAELGIRPETLAALTLIPLVQVAWADGVMDNKERDAILEGAVSSGISRESASYGLLEIWTVEEPSAELTRAWRDFIAALAKELTDEERHRLRDNVLTRAYDVADAAGGFLGSGPRVSAEERAVMDDLGSAFGT